MSDREKLNGNPYPQALITGFCSAIQDCCLFDVCFSGSSFTWHHGDTYERLDRGLASQDWLERYPEANILVLPSPTSYHSPLFVSLCKNGGYMPRTRPFRFEDMWLTHPGCEEVVIMAWDSVSNGDTLSLLMDKIKACAVALTRWNKEHFGIVQRQVRQYERRFQELREQVDDHVAREEEKKMLLESGIVLDREEILWRQKSRILYLQEGERNTIFSC